MSTATPEIPRAARGTAPTSTTLTRVELRKMVDTRAGRWILIAAAAIAVVVAITRGVTGDAADRTFGDAFQLTLLPAGFLLPIIGILAATGEWSQRTALTTFALVPRRERVVAAKGSAVVVLGLAGLVIGLLAAAVGSALAATVGDAPDAWSIGGGDLAQGVLFQVLSVLWGLAFGLVLVAPALAIVAFFVLPVGFTLLGALGDGLSDALAWVDPNRAFSPLADGSTAGDDWAKVALVTVLWIVLPLAAGVVLTLRREVK